MLSVLFWNIHQNAVGVASCLSRLAAGRSLDVLFLAECPAERSSILEALGPKYRAVDGIGNKVQAITRLPKARFLHHHTNLGGDMTIWKVKAADPPLLLLATAHPLARMGGNTHADQQGRATTLARELASIEERAKCSDTVLVGDLNMSPYDDGMVIATGLYGVMTREIACRPDRVNMGETYRRFYNPMWGFFGDRTPGPPGTYYFRSSATSNRHWYIIDQVLVRPSLAERLSPVEILDGDGERSFLSPDGLPDAAGLSDHLPLFFALDL